MWDSTLRAMAPATVQPIILRRAGRAAAKAIEAVAVRDDLIQTAGRSGCSLRAIAEATGLSHMTVKRIVARSPTPKDVSENLVP